MEEKSEFRNELAERVKLARENAGYTQERMAKFLGISQPTYSKYEGGRGHDPASGLPPHLFADFCSICRVSADWLLGVDGFEARNPTGRPRKGQVA